MIVLQNWRLVIISAPCSGIGTQVNGFIDCCKEEVDNNKKYLNFVIQVDKVVMIQNWQDS